MALIKWNNVNAQVPSTSGDLEVAGNFLNKAFEQGKGILTAQEQIEKQNKGVRSKTNTTSITDKLLAAGNLSELNKLAEDHSDPALLRAKFGGEVNPEEVQSVIAGQRTKLENKAGTELFNQGLQMITDGADIQDVQAELFDQSKANNFSNETTSKVIGDLTSAFERGSKLTAEQEYDVKVSEDIGLRMAAAGESELQEAQRRFEVDHVDPFKDIRNAGGGSGADIAIKEAGVEDFLNWSNEKGAGGDDLRELFNDYKLQHPDTPYWIIQQAVKENPVTDTNGFFSGGFTMEGMKKAVEDIRNRNNAYNNKLTAHIERMNKRKSEIQSAVDERKDATFDLLQGYTQEALSKSFGRYKQ